MGEKERGHEHDEVVTTGEALGNSCEALKTYTVIVDEENKLLLLPDNN